MVNQEKSVSGEDEHAEGYCFGCGEYVSDLAGRIGETCLNCRLDDKEKSVSGGCDCGATGPDGRFESGNGRGNHSNQCAVWIGIEEAPLVYDGDRCSDCYLGFHAGHRQ